MRLAPLSFLLALLSSCGAATFSSSSARPPLHVIQVTPPVRLVTLHSGEHRTFRPGALRPGDIFTCKLAGQNLHVRVPNRPAGAWAIGMGAATPSGAKGQLQLQSRPDGSVVASCGRKAS